MKTNHHLRLSALTAAALLCASASAATLPEGYALLSYAASTGTQRIDTGIYPKATTRVVIDFQYPSVPTAAAYCGWGSSGSAEAFLFGANQTAFYAVISSNWKSSPTGVASDTARHVYDLAKGAMYFDGVLFSTTNTLGSTATSAQTMYLFASRVEWSPYVAYNCSMEIYTYQIYDGATLVRSFVPVQRLSDSVVGLYESASTI